MTTRRIVVESGGRSLLRPALRLLALVAGGVPLTMGVLTMAARPTMFEGDVVQPASSFSASWETVKRPGFRPSAQVERLKPLHIETPLVQHGKPAAKMLIPPGRTYDAEARRLQDAIRDRTDVDLPIEVMNSAIDPAQLLTEHHIITFGNMATNPLIFRLYCRWQTLLDLKWPGPGGHALLSLHNPYGSGRNAILVGGSDAAGVTASCQQLVTRIESTTAADAAGSLVLGWLHDVRLPAGTEIPRPEQGGEVHYWAGAPGKGGPLGSVKCFGWNSIATYACLYYMTGREEFAEEFRRLAMSRPGQVPEALREDYAYWNPANPLVESYHYYSHLIPCLWDLIEESPLFSDEDRVFVTNKLIEQQDHYDPHDSFATPNGSRHCGYQMLNIFTGSRYLATYYPEKRWFVRLANMRAAFDAWRTSVTWGELDLVTWLPTSEEFVLNFFILDNQWESFAESGAAAELLAPQLHCWTGRRSDPVNENQSLSMMHKGAWVTGDSSWVWLARQAPYQLDRFRIGQSWWPSEALAPTPPREILHRVSNVPLQRTYWQQLGRPIPLELGSQFLTYRTTLDEGGDYLRLDVSWFCDRTPYHLATPDVLRIDGAPVIQGLGSLVSIYRRGLLETAATPQTAAVTGRAGSRRGCAISLFTPNASYAEWRRSVLHQTGRRTVFVDEIVPREAGDYELKVLWKIAGAPGVTEAAGASRFASDQVDMICLGISEASLQRGAPAVSASGPLRAGQPRRVLTIMQPRQQDLLGVRRLGSHAAIVAEDTLICAGPQQVGTVAFSGEALLLSPEVLCMTRAEHLRIGDWEFASSSPVTASWDLDDGSFRVWSEDVTEIQLGARSVKLKAGVSQHLHVAPAQVSSVVQALRPGAEALPLTVERSSSPDLVLNGHARWDRGQGKTSLLLPDKTSWARLTASPPQKMAGFSIAAWIKPEHLITREQSAETRIACQALAAQWDVAGNQRSWMLLLAHDKLSFWASPDGRLESVCRVGCAVPLTTAWTHVAALYDEGRLRLYINGSEQANAEVGPLHRTGTAVSIGRYLNGYPFVGRLRGLRIDIPALEPEQIARSAGPNEQTEPQHLPPPWFTMRPPETGPAQAERDWHPVWSRHCPGPIRQLRRSAEEASGEIWAGAAHGFCLLLRSDGVVRRVIQLPAEITAMAAIPKVEVADAPSLVVGLINDDVLGLTADGNILWSERAEVDDSFWLDGHWRAPWFTDPEACHGVLDLRIMRWHHDQPPEIALGRACTVELRSLDGELIQRMPVRWGDRATLASSVDADENPILVAANWLRSLRADMQKITAERRVAGGIYRGLPGDYSRIPGHGQGFRFPFLKDLDGDGNKEFGAALCGTWNDLAVYDAKTENPLWCRVFGPWHRGADSLLCGVALGELDDTGQELIAAASRSGWVWVFTPDGDLQWSRRLEYPVEAVTIWRQKVIAATDAGEILALDSDGNTLHRARLRGMVTHLLPAGPRMIAATDAGHIAAFPDPNEQQVQGTVQTEAGLRREVRVNGVTQHHERLPAEEGSALMLIPLETGSGVYRGTVTVRTSEPGGAATLALGSQHVVSIDPGSVGTHTAPIPPTPVLSAAAVLSVKLSRGCELSALQIERVGPGATMSDVNTVDEVPALDGWTKIEAESCLASSTGTIAPRSGYLNGATVLHGFGKTASRADWQIELARPARVGIAIRYASTFEPLLATLQIDGHVPKAAFQMMRFAPTPGWGYEENHWCTGIAGGSQWQQLSIELDAGVHTLSLISQGKAMNIDWLALIPVGK